MTAVNGVSNRPFVGSLTDPSKHAQIYQYLEALKKDELGWKKSADNIVAEKLSNEEEHFLLLQVVEDYLARRYAVADSDSVMCIRSLLSHWIQKLLSAQEQPAFLMNKMAHIFSLVFAADFPERWPSFMDDIFLSRGFDSVPLVVFYLKTLLAIDAEVVDRDIQRTKQMFDRNTKIKDFMREICITQLVQSWWNILGSVSDVASQCLCLDVISAFVDWIDVELVANDVFVPLVLTRLSNKDTTESAVHAVSALIQKGMPPEKKLSLVMALTEVLRSNNLISVTPNSDYDDVLRAGTLLNCVGLVLLDCHSKLKADSQLTDAARCLEAMEADLDTCLLVLDNEDPELSELVIDTIRSYAQLMREDSSQARVTVLSRVIAVCLRRYAMSEELDVDGEGEDELDFHEYRKELRTLINAIGMKRPDLLIAPLETLTNDVVSNGSAMPIGRLEAVVQIVYALSELIPSNFVQMKDGWMGRAAQLPVTLLSSMTLDGRSATVHVLYFEMACRYERLLSARPQAVVPQVAAAFLDERGIAIPVSRVRTRIVYLFCRFVKAHKAVLSPLVSEVIGRLAPLLAVSPQAEQFLTADDQAFIFEATATLIVFGELAVEQKAQYIRELATTLATKFQSAVSELQLARSRQDAATVKIVATFMGNIIGYCSRMSKAFNNAQSMQNCHCFDIYINLLNLFLEQLTADNAFLLESVRQLAHRLVVCLDTELLPILPVLMNKLAAVSNDLDSMNHLLILCHQIVAKHKKNALSSGVDFCAILTTAARFSVVPEETEASRAQDEAAQRNLVYVQRAFLQLLYTSTLNEMLPEIAPGSTMDDLLEAACRLALGSDQSAQKLALSTLAKVAAVNDNWWQRTLRTALEVPALSHISPADAGSTLVRFSLFTLSHISPADAGSTLVVHEVSSTLLALRQAHPNDFVVALRSLLPSPMGENLITLLETLKSKELDKQIMHLYSNIKTGQQH